jgi:hypothetical protein
MSDKKRLGWIDMSDEEIARLGPRPRDYCCDDQHFWYSRVVYWKQKGVAQFYPAGDFLSECFGVDDLCFDGSGITHASSLDSLAIPSRLFLVKNVPLSMLNHRTQTLGKTEDGILLD